MRGMNSAQAPDAPDYTQCRWRAENVPFPVKRINMVFSLFPWTGGWREARAPFPSETAPGVGRALRDAYFPPCASVRLLPAVLDPP